MNVDILGELKWLQPSANVPMCPDPSAAAGGDDASSPGKQPQQHRAGATAPQAALALRVAAAAIADANLTMDVATEVDYGSQLEPNQLFSVRRAPFTYDRCAAWRSVKKYTPEEAVSAFTEVASHLAWYRAVGIVARLLGALPMWLATELNEPQQHGGSPTTALGSSTAAIAVSPSPIGSARHLVETLHPRMLATFVSLVTSADWAAVVGPVMWRATGTAAIFDPTMPSRLACAALALPKLSTISGGNPRPPLGDDLGASGLLHSSRTASAATTTTAAVSQLFLNNALMMLPLASSSTVAHTAPAAKPVGHDLFIEVFSELVYHVIACPPEPLIYESAHPCKPMHEPPREVFVAGNYSYDVHFDRHMTQSCNVQMTFYLDSSLTCAVYRCVAGAEMPSIRIDASRFYFDVRLESTASHLWGYKMVVHLGTMKLLRAVDTIEQLIRSELPPSVVGDALERVVDWSALVVEGLVFAMCRNVGVVRRRLATLVTRYVARLSHLLTRGDVFVMSPEQLQRTSALLAPPGSTSSLQQSSVRLFSTAMDLLTTHGAFVLQRVTGEPIGAAVATPLSARLATLERQFSRRYRREASRIVCSRCCQAMTELFVALEEFEATLQRSRLTYRSTTDSRTVSGGGAENNIQRRLTSGNSTVAGEREEDPAVITKSTPSQEVVPADQQLPLQSTASLQLATEFTAFRQSIRSLYQDRGGSGAPTHLATLSEAGALTGGPERVHVHRCRYPQALRIDGNPDRTVTVTSEAHGAMVCASTALRHGLWYYEVVLIAPVNEITVGLISERFDPEVDFLDTSRDSWCLNLNQRTVAPRGLRARDVIGVLMDMSRRQLAVTLNGTPVARPLALPGGQYYQGGSVFIPALMFRHGTVAVINFGCAHFEGDCPVGYLPLDPAALAIGSLLPLRPMRGFVDLFYALVTETTLPSPTHPMPAFVHKDRNPFEALGDARRGPPLVSIANANAKSAATISLLEVRNNDRHFATVVSDCSVHASRWYYEVQLHTTGTVQVGWTTPSFACAPESGRGVGDDSQSIAIDMGRRVHWWQGTATPIPGATHKRWVPGDIVGCSVDFASGNLSFSLNGNNLLTLCARDVGIRLKDGLIPAASLRSGTVLTFNFGSLPLRHKPDGYRSMSVSDTWRERIDLYYNASFTAAGHVAPVSLEKDAQLPIGAAEKCVNAALASTLDRLCVAQGRASVYQVDTRTNTAMTAWTPWLETPTLVGGDATTTSGSQKFRSISEIEDRIRALQLFDRLFLTVAPYVTFNDDGERQRLPAWSMPSYSAAATSGNLQRPSLDNVASSPITRLFLEARPLFFQSSRLAVVTRALKETAVHRSGTEVRLTLNRTLAARRNAHPTSLDPTGVNSLFGQTYSLLGAQMAKIFRSSQRFWTVAFGGEGAEDVGGPFREHLTAICAELMSPALDLFIPAPNQVHNVGVDRDAWIPNPSAVSSLQLDMFRFLGRIMGGALRIGEPLSLYFPRAVWKALAFRRLSGKDVASWDHLCVQFVDAFAEFDPKAPEAAEAFEDAFTTQMFVTQLSDKSTVEVIADGSTTPVTLERTAEYAACVLRTRLNEFASPLLAIRDGLCSVVPPIALACLEPNELQVRICGQADFSVAELKESTSFEGMSPFDRRVTFLWQVLEDATPAERRLFLRFVSGRERLPVRLRVLPMAAPSGGAGDPDGMLPRAATCFFALELPDYSSVDVMRARVMYAITSCFEIDTDFRARDFGENDAPQLALAMEDGSRPTAPIQQQQLDDGGDGTLSDIIQSDARYVFPSHTEAD